MWRKSRLKLIENKKNDLIWLLVHRAIRVRYALMTWGYINSHKCAICNRSETIEHCFLKCPRIVKVWDHFSPLISTFLESPFSVSPKSVYYPFSFIESSTGACLSRYLIATILYWCWFARNRATFHNSNLNHDKIIQLIKNDIQIRVQRKASNKSWVVTFDSAVTKEDALEVATIEVGGVPVFLGDCENRLVLVKMYEAPAELPDMALIGCLSYYGRVLSFRRDRIADSIDNGVRTARMRLHRHIPSTINLAGKFIRVWYPTQPKTCRNCGSDEHMVKDCDSMRCFNCEQPGHHSRDCELPVLCTLCKDAEHDLNNCPFVLYSANIDASTDGSATKRQNLVNEQRKNRQERKEQAKQTTKENITRASADKSKDSASARSQQHSNRPERSTESTNERQHRREDERREGGSCREDRERREDQREERERSRQSERRDRDRDREVDRRERREREEFEEWKALKRREEERFERDHYHRRDLPVSFPAQGRYLPVLQKG